MSAARRRRGGGRGASGLLVLGLLAATAGLLSLTWIHGGGWSAEKAVHVIPPEAATRGLAVWIVRLSDL